MRQLLLALLVAACAAIEAPWAPQSGALTFGPVRSETDALAAARLLTELEGPVQIVGQPRRGVASSLYTGASMALTDDAAKDELAKRGRMAWRVDLTSLARGGCGPVDCPMVPSTQQLIIDEATGAVLYSVIAYNP